MSFQALAKFQSSHKFTTKTGIEQEDALLNESAAKESSLTLHILELENETKQVGQKMKNPRRTNLFHVFLFSYAMNWIEFETSVIECYKRTVKLDEINRMPIPKN